MGWNSYDTFGDSVTESEVLANAHYINQHLRKHGWQYIVIDFRWYDPHPTGDDRLLNPTRTGAKLAADDFGRLLPAPNRFPSALDGNGFRNLADQIHRLGLRFGLHMMRGIPRQAFAANSPIEGGPFHARDAGDANDRCPWCPDMFGVRDNAAGQAWYDSGFRLAASWGLDYVKVDDLSEPYDRAEIEMIRRAIDRCGRPIVFSTSPGPTNPIHAAHIRQYANLWRISGDFWDRWAKLDAQFDLMAQWHGQGGPGHWPDADMIPFGHIAIRSKLGGNEHWTHFTHDEQVCLMSFWAIAPSPLMLGMNLPDDDPQTLALLTNDEVLAVNQDPLCRPAQRLWQHDRTEIWTKDLSNGDLAVGMFNRSNEAQTITFSIPSEKMPLRWRARDLWSHTDYPQSSNAKLIASVPSHGARLWRIRFERRSSN